jgi:hypothetical protein
MEGGPCLLQPTRPPNLPYLLHTQVQAQRQLRSRGTYLLDINILC